MKGLSDIFIHRPVMTTLVMFGVLLFGITGYRLLPVSDLPNVDFPTIQVSAGLPGASPETMASAVATPLEKQFSTIAGLDSMTSASQLGSTQIVLQFNLSRNIDAAAQDVQSAISVAQGNLPNDMPNPPSFKKVNPADKPIIYFALTSPTLPLSDLDEYGETLLAQRISMVSGVAQVVVYGSQKYAVRIRLDPNRLANKGIGLDDVASAVEQGNVNLPTGTLDGQHVAYTVQATGQLENAAAYRPLIVAYRNGSPVRLEDLGVVLDSVENDKTAAWYVDATHNDRSVILAIQRQPGTNTVKVAGDVRKLVTTLQTQIPASVSLHVLYDRSGPIQDSVNDVKLTLLLALVLVVLVIFVFLRNLSATAIPSLALPMSIIGTFIVMYYLGYSLDNLSLMALTLSVGFVVDDAIVMLENIVRHMELGEEKFSAALKGSREIGFTILSMTLSLAAVFIPVLFIGGIIGRLFHEFAVTIAAAILISGFVSLTLTPMLCSRFLNPPSQERRSAIYEASERIFNKMLSIYDKALRWSLNHRRLVIIFSGIILLATVYLFIAIPKGFIPSEDRSAITFLYPGCGRDFCRCHDETPTGRSRGGPGRPQHEKVSSPPQAPEAPDPRSNTGILFMHLKPRNQRKYSADQIIERLRPKLAKIPGIMTFQENPPPIQIGGRLSQSPIPGHPARRGH